MEKDQKKTLYKMGLPIILGTILLIGVSYAWLTLTLNGTKTNVLKAGTLSLTLTDDSTEGINLENTVPMLDEVGVTTSPYSFTLTNNGDIDSGYTIYLDDVTLDTNETRLADTYIKYNLVKDGTSKITALLSTTGTNPNRVLDSGTIKPGETYSYDLRLWIDQDATTAISGKVFKGKIRVEASQTGPKEVTPESCFTFDSSTGTITDYSDSCTKDVVIPRTINGVAVTTIGVSAFWNNKLTNVVIPASVTYIYSEAFASNQLTSIVIPGSVTTIEDYVFSYNQLTSVVIPNSVTTIRYGAFTGNQLTSVVIPNSVTTIEREAFNNNQLPDNQAFIYERNSDGTEDKTTIISYGGAKRDNVIIPEGVTTIGESAFSSNQLTSVTIGNSVTTIGHGAFYGNQLTSVVIPDSVTTIRNDAFSSNQLTSVIIKGKSSTSDFTSYGYSVFGWASGYSDDDIIWNG